MSIFNKKSIRLKTQTQGQNDNYVTLQMNQTYDFINVLSLKLPTKNIFQQFSSDFGIIAGRVNAMGGVGVPNVKVGIFIPKDNQVISTKLARLKTDIQRDRIRIAELLYQYDSIDSKDSSGKRFNLLPSKSRNRLFNGWPFNMLGIGATPKTPLGTFPEKEMILSDENWLYVYDNYYYLVTTTNNAGDFMIYAPVGIHTLHMDCDITDIGKFSTTPAIMSKTLGYSPSLFESQGTKVRNTNDLNQAPNIVSYDVSVTVKPLWNQDTDNPEVGITRQDFDLGVELKPSFTIFGTTLNMNRNAWYFDNVVFHMFLGLLKFPIVQGNDISIFSVGGDCGSYLNVVDIGDCGCGPGTGKSGGFRFGIKFAVNIELPRLVGGSFDDFEFPHLEGGSICVNFRMKICLVLPAIFPVVKIRAFTNRPCVVDSGDYEFPSTGIFWLGPTEYCEGYGVSISDLVNNSDIISKNLNSAEELINVENIMTEINLFSRKNINQTIDPNNDIDVIDKSDYVSFIDNGMFCLQIPTNKTKVITAEDGTLIESQDETRGVYSTFDGYIIADPKIELGNAPNKISIATLRLKVPQNPTDANDVYNSYYTFNLGEVYSVSQFIPTLNIGDDCNYWSGTVAVCNDYANLTGKPHKILSPNKLDNINNMPATEFNVNFNVDEPFDVLRGTWLNFALYFINIGYRRKYRNRKSLSFCSQLITNENKLKLNGEPLGGGMVNTQYMSNPNYIQTTFIKLNKHDFIGFASRIEKGYNLR